MAVYEVRLLDLAERDLDEICQYLSGFYPGTPGKFLDNLEKDFNYLALNPKMYPRYEFNTEYRKMASGNYLVFFKTDEENSQVNIYRILHEKRDISVILAGQNGGE